MNTCRDLQKDRAAFLAGELGPERKERMASHLQGCARCREEVDRMRKVIDAAGLVRGEMESAMASVDWEALPAKVTDYVFGKTARPRRLTIGERLRPIRPVLIPAYAGIVLGIILGSLATFLILKRQAPSAVADNAFFASPEFIDRVELEMARRQTLDYLQKSQYLLLDLAQASSLDKGRGMDMLASGRAKDLLAKKKYLNPQLENSRMAKAKAICDQIELLFLELSQISDDLTGVEMKRIQGMIEDRRLLLKISLVEKELEESEV